MIRALLPLLCAFAAFADEAGPVVLMPIAEDFNATEFWPMWHGLRATGYRVVVAAPQAGAVASGKLPFPDAVALSDDQRSAFALVIAGGKAPAALEAVPLAVDLARHFMVEGRPVSAICHGPRLLARAGMLQGRVATAWHEVADETPERWRSGAYGSYVDQAVVRDGNLVTSRYPEDVTPWVRATIAQLAERGGLPQTTGHRRVLVINPAAPGWVQHAVVRTLPALLDGVEVIREGQVAERIAQDEEWDAVVVLDGSRLDRLADRPDEVAWLTACRAAGTPVFFQPQAAGLLPTVQGDALPPASDTEQAHALLLALRDRLVAFPARTAPPPPPPDAWLALAPGFDERAAAILGATAEAQGLRLAAVAPTPGWQRGLHGGVVEAWGTYDLPPPGAGAVVLAPGGFAPGWSDPIRTAWLLAAWRKGATVIAVGTDVLGIGRDPACRGLELAGSPQVRWSYGKTGGTHVDAPARQSAPRLLTIAGTSALGQSLTLVHQVLRHD